MKKEIIALLILGLIFLSGCTQPTSPVNETPDTTVTTTAPEEETYTLTQVAEHNSNDDCWLVLDGKVYDVTGFIGSHPGGAAIIEGCGTDATTLFETRPMGSGTPHSINARNLQENYYIGELA
jgi:cytochrome b involved in lipid metabolism